MYLYVHIYACIHLHIYIYMYKHVYIYTCVYIHIHVYIYTFVCMHVCIYMYKYMYFCIYTYSCMSFLGLYTHICIHMHICAFLHIYHHEPSSLQHHTNTSKQKITGHTAEKHFYNTLNISLNTAPPPLPPHTLTSTTRTWGKGSWGGGKEEMCIRISECLTSKMRICLRKRRWKGEGLEIRNGMFCVGLAMGGVYIYIYMYIFFLVHWSLLVLMGRGGGRFAMVCVV